MLVLLVKKIIFSTHFSSFNVEALLYPPLALSCLVALSRLLSSLLFSFRSRSPSLLFPLFVFFKQAMHWRTVARVEKRIKTLAFPRVLRELAANWVLAYTVTALF